MADSRQPPGAPGADSETVDFGYERVARPDKQRRVGAVFDSVADNYDLMNDLMSMGIHRAWKRFTISLAAVRPGESILDLASGTGDLAAGFAKKVGADGRVLMSDINHAMLANGRDRMIDRGLVSNVDYCLANAEKLPFADDAFDCVTIAFGLRNVTDKQAALNEMARVTRPGGRTIVLEFSKPALPGLGLIYDRYSFSVLPWLGKNVARDEDSYRYLAESIRMHPDQETLKGMMVEAGFVRCGYHNLTGGIVAVHRGYAA
ncbi:bifunctional demethylmenaquinone methyltransferase/2-methoxy-6-polyprenyl-1,4-benzoquinol methylase UbiE [Salinisphaera sp. Q1T1-3]|uniref:bifunctional demethylmenaquinone methyltransferase/2-methoxy-6-polyprenyl-1,4-benzoquinol methylase UbiE n=1 Tax=Salinisphaera sp. Q1T1-3 TaxID=2321229 RepID=UPI000E7626B1|nr:bifunctional demethylmenaquinone methyltransferase/2-methoxy-6-polyprenyl-1,4-benzoquinol methylase UbiE [Salinisphaera sp. Q1T1-3]RJS91634.1 bifunctional demethylmenaquinone methyltransferase/2-methoxy-6-polyprenyl-1,4-benzoquinol methylase UbiE [Salinisphaera sp. Q1T1-3]